MTSDLVARLVALAREEQMSLWSDLECAFRRAIRCKWSMEAEWIRDRIVDHARLVGPTSWENVSVWLIIGGDYAKVYTDAGIVYPDVDLGRVYDVADRQRASADLLPLVRPS